MEEKIFDELVYRIHQLEKENERLNNLFEYNMQTLVNTDKLYEDYKTRCEKAIKYLEEAVEGLEEYHFDGYDPNLAYVISILKGDK